MSARTDFVVSFEDRPYLQWQIRLLLWSFEKVRRPGERVVLAIVGERVSQYTRALIERYRPGWLVIPVPRCLQLRARPEVHTWRCYNKPYALREIVRDRAAFASLAPHVISIDPDTLFLRPFSPRPRPGRAIGTRVAFPYDCWWKDVLEDVLEVAKAPREIVEWDEGHPLNINGEWGFAKHDLKAVAPRWTSLTRRLAETESITRVIGWVAEGVAGVLATWLAGLRIEPLAGHTVYNADDNAPDEQPPGGASLLHYCYGVTGLFQKKTIWDGAVDPRDGEHGSIKEPIVLERVAEARRRIDRNRYPLTARLLDDLEECLSGRTEREAPPPAPPEGPGIVRASWVVDPDEP